MSSVKPVSMNVLASRQSGATRAGWSVNWMIRMKEYWFLIRIQATSLKVRLKIKTHRCKETIFLMDVVIPTLAKRAEASHPWAVAHTPDQSVIDHPVGGPTPSSRLRMTPDSTRFADSATPRTD